MWLLFAFFFIGIFYGCRVWGRFGGILIFVVKMLGIYCGFGGWKGMKAHHTAEQKLSPSTSGYLHLPTFKNGVTKAMVCVILSVG